MQSYLDIVRRVLTKGKTKRPVRKKEDGTFEDVVIHDEGKLRAVSTLACPNVFFSHDMADGFPLLTTKKMPWKTLKVELEGFIKGITSKKWYQERGCKIWDEWCNPQALKQYQEPDGSWNWRLTYRPDGSIKTDAEVKAERQFYEDDLGPIYGYQWRHFGQHHGEFDTWEVGEPNAGGEYQWDDNRNGLLTEGFDQLKNICDTLRSNPHDRRMVCSAWNPNQMNQMALPPCHYAWNVTVIDGELNLFWAQRSCDLMLGVPFNIASYGLLLHLLAKHANLKEGNLSACFVDCHIYENQIEAAEAQLSREPLPLCNVYTRSNDIFKWDHTDSDLVNYKSHDKLDFGSIAI